MTSIQFTDTRQIAQVNTVLKNKITFFRCDVHVSYMYHTLVHTYTSNGLHLLYFKKTLNTLLE